VEVSQISAAGEDPQNLRYTIRLGHYQDIPASQFPAHLAAVGCQCQSAGRGDEHYGPGEDIILTRPLDVMESGATSLGFLGRENEAKATPLVNPEIGERVC
jgi:hypothetical protein